MKFAIPIALVAIMGLAAWIALKPVEALAPPDKPANVTKKKPATAGEATTSGSSGTQGAAVTSKPKAAKARAYAKSKKTAALAEARRKAMAARPTVEPPPRAEPRERKWGLMGKGGEMPSYPASTLKDGIRRYYANLPKSGLVPARIEIEEILPRDLVRALNLPSTARIVELGDRPASSREAFKEALAKDVAAQPTLGITVEADGERYREYIKLTE